MCTDECDPIWSYDTFLLNAMHATCDARCLQFEFMQFELMQFELMQFDDECNDVACDMMLRAILTSIHGHGACMFKK